MAWVLVVIAVAAFAQKPAPADLDAVLVRFDAYLEKYESELSAVVADEVFHQELPPLPQTPLRPAQTRKLDSEVAFLRLPGDAEWLGFRRVKRVDGRAVDDSYESLTALLSLSASDRKAQALLLVARSSEHNLGNARTINMPNLPLELLQRKHRQRFEIAVEGTDRVRGRDTIKLLLKERASPSLILFGGHADLLSRIHVWVDANTGALLRAQTRFESRSVGGNAPRLDVEFEADRTLEILVPTSMREEFLIFGTGLGKGRATYSNFRRFQTSARIVPPPPE